MSNVYACETGTLSLNDTFKIFLFTTVDTKTPPQTLNSGYRVALRAAKMHIMQNMKNSAPYLEGIIDNIKASAAEYGIHINEISVIKKPS